MPYANRFSYKSHKMFAFAEYLRNIFLLIDLFKLKLLHIMFMLFIDIIDSHLTLFSLYLVGFSNSALLVGHHKQRFG